MTSENNRNPKSKNRAANQAAIEQISELYPNTFSREAVKPLKIGIQEDLLTEEKLSKGKIKRALASYVRSVRYYKSLQGGVARIDLEGKEVGVVSEQEAEYAKAMLKKIREDKQQRIKQEQEQAHQKLISDKLALLVSKTSG